MDFINKNLKKQNKKDEKKNQILLCLAQPKHSCLSHPCEYFNSRQINELEKISNNSKATYGNVSVPILDLDRQALYMDSGMITHIATLAVV